MCKYGSSCCVVDKSCDGTVYAFVCDGMQCVEVAVFFVHLQLEVFNAWPVAQVELASGAGAALSCASCEFDHKGAIGAVDDSVVLNHLLSK